MCAKLGAAILGLDVLHLSNRLRYVPVVLDFSGLSALKSTEKLSASYSQISNTNSVFSINPCISEMKLCFFNNICIPILHLGHLSECVKQLLCCIEISRLLFYSTSFANSVGGIFFLEP
jgi:hypothetical protein